MKNAKSEKIWAHTLSKTHLGKYSKNKPVSKPTFSDRLNDASFRGPQDKVLLDVKTGHRTPDTEHLKKRKWARGAYLSSVQCLESWVLRREFCGFLFRVQRFQNAAFHILFFLFS